MNHCRQTPVFGVVRVKYFIARFFASQVPHHTRHTHSISVRQILARRFRRVGVRLKREEQIVPAFREALRDPRALFRESLPSPPPRGRPHPALSRTAATTWTCPHPRYFPASLVGRTRDRGRSGFVTRPAHPVAQNRSSKADAMGVECAVARAVAVQQQALVVTPLANRARVRPRHGEQFGCGHVRTRQAKLGPSSRPRGPARGGVAITPAQARGPRGRPDDEPRG